MEKDRKPKPQILLKIYDEYGNVHLIKKWYNGSFSIEGHTKERAINHNMNVSEYFFPIDESYCEEFFRKNGKEFRKDAGM